MIIGQDLCHVLGVIVDYDDCIIRLKSGIISMQQDIFLNCKGQVPMKQFNQMIAQSQEPKVTAKATERIVQILDSDYHKADLNQVLVAKATQLTKE